MVREGKGPWDRVREIGLGDHSESEKRKGGEMQD